MPTTADHSALSYLKNDLKKIAAAS